MLVCCWLSSGMSEKEGGVCLERVLRECLGVVLSLAHDLKREGRDKMMKAGAKAQQTAAYWKEQLMGIQGSCLRAAPAVVAVV